MPSSTSTFASSSAPSGSGQATWQWRCRRFGQGGMGVLQRLLQFPALRLPGGRQPPGEAQETAGSA
eukprot:10946167-Alexandrium_andersonii.AAC.1